MKGTIEKAPINRQQTRWLITGVTTMILGVTAMANHVAYADSVDTDTTTSDIDSSQTTDSPALQQSSVNLKTQPVTTNTETPTDETTEESTKTTTPAPEAVTDSTKDTAKTPDTDSPSLKPESAENSATLSSESPNTNQNTTAESSEPTTTDDQSPKADTPAATQDSATTTNDDTSTTSNTDATKAVVQPAAFKATRAAADETIDQWMPNKLLQAEVLRQLRAQNPGKTWNSAADITKEDMLLLTTYRGTETYIDGKTAYSLEGLQYATNLTSLTLNSALNSPSGYYFGDVQDITPLGNLTKLTLLDIQDNSISDISVLANLTNLKDLRASFNHISDFRPLQNIAGLTVEYGNQYIYISDPAYVDRNNNTANLAGNYYLADGTHVQLQPNGGIAEPVRVNGTTLYYSWYFNGATGGNYDGTGGLTLTGLNEQKPGITGQYNGSIVVPVDDYYFLTGSYGTPNQVYFGVVRPYILSDAAAPVNVEYVDALTNQVLGTATLTGVLDQPYTTQRADDYLPDFTFTRVSDNASGTFTATAQTVTYYYTRKDAGDVTAILKDNHGNELGHTTLPGQNALGLTFNIDAPDLPNYTLTSTDKTINGTFTEAPQTITFVYTRNNAADVTIKYQDQAGNELAPDVTLDGSEKLGLAVPDQAKEIQNYTLVRVDGTLSYTDTAHTVTYIYQRSDAADVTIKYQDENGTKLADDKVLSGTGQLGMTIPDQQLVIPGYTFKELQNRAAGIFTDKEQTFIYVYSRNVGQTVTVKYVDENGKQLNADVPLNGYEGDDYHADQLVIDGYTYLRTEGTANGIFTDKPQTVTFVYTQTAGKTVTVKYVDENGQSLHDDVPLNGFVNDPYTAEQLTIDGYDFKEVQGNATGKFTDDPQTVTFVYTRSAGKTVTVKYVDDQGNVLHDDIQLNGKLDEAYTAEQLTIDGYDFKEVQGNVTGKFTGEPQTVTFSYTRSAGQPVTVKYVDENGQPLRSDMTLTGKLGTAYTTEQLVFDGYTFKAVQGLAAGTFTAEPQTVTYVYSQDPAPVKTGTVTVHYVTKDGQILHAPLTLSGNSGDAYQTNALSLTGYQLVAQPANASGTYTDGNLDVVYVYEPVEVTTGDGDQVDPDDNQQPEKPTESQDGQQDDHLNATEKPATSQPMTSKKATVHPVAASAQLTAAPVNPAVTKDNQVLPQTDDHVSVWGAVLGALLAGLASLGLYHQKRRIK